MKKILWAMTMFLALVPAYASACNDTGECEFMSWMVCGTDTPWQAIATPWKNECQIWCIHFGGAGGGIQYNHLAYNCSSGYVYSLPAEDACSYYGEDWSWWTSYEACCEPDIHGGDPICLE